jgi:hypothetical protein
VRIGRIILITAKALERKNSNLGVRVSVEHLVVSTRFYEIQTDDVRRLSAAL